MKCRLILILSCVASSVAAQVPEDALRYSWYGPNGTARNQALGGVVGSLGGDITATFVNPAGLGLYKTIEIVLTPGFGLFKNKTNFRGTPASDNKNGFNFGPSGFVVGSGNMQNPRRSNAFSLAVTRTANFNSNIYYEGENDFSSYSEQFLEELRNNRADTNAALTGFPFTSSLAYYSYLIDTIRNANGSLGGFRSLAPLSTGLFQENSIQTRGGITEIALGYAANMNDKFYIGGSIGLPILNYSRTTNFRESDLTNNTNNNFNYSDYTHNYSAKGVGLNLRVGMIVKPVESLRLGLALHTPTVYGLSDKTTASMTTDVENYGGSSQVISVTSDELNNNQPGIYRYNFATPWKFLVSGAYVLHEVEDVKNQKGFISADVEYVTFGSPRFTQTETDTGDDEYYRQVNNVISESYKGVLNYKIGGELKFNTFMVRAGVGFYGNPYKDNYTDDSGSDVKAKRVNLSGGLGYRNKGIFVDLAYTHSMSKDVNFPYRLSDKANTYAIVKGTTGNALLTLGFKF